MTLTTHFHAKVLEANRFFVDRVSGKYEHRPELDRLWRDRRKRKVDAAVVYRYDRFARSLHQLVSALEEFRSLGIEFVSLQKNGEREGWLRPRDTPDMP